MTIKRKRIYEIIIISLVIMFTSLCAYMGITAVQKSMKLNLSFAVNPNVAIQIDAMGENETEYSTIFQNSGELKIKKGVSLTGNTLSFSDAYATALGTSLKLKITNLNETETILSEFPNGTVETEVGEITGLITAVGDEPTELSVSSLGTFEIDFFNVLSLDFVDNSNGAFELSSNNLKTVGETKYAVIGGELELVYTLNSGYEEPSITAKVGESVVATASVEGSTYTLKVPANKMQSGLTIILDATKLGYSVAFSSQEVNVGNMPSNLVSECEITLTAKTSGYSPAMPVIEGTCESDFDFVSGTLSLSNIESDISISCTANPWMYGDYVGTGGTELCEEITASDGSIDVYYPAFAGYQYVKFVGVDARWIIVGTGEKAFSLLEGGYQAMLADTTGYIKLPQTAYAGANNGDVENGGGTNTELGSDEILLFLEQTTEEVQVSAPSSNFNDWVDEGGDYYQFKEFIVEKKLITNSRDSRTESEGNIVFSFASLYNYDGTTNDNHQSQNFVIERYLGDYETSSGNIIAGTLNNHRTFSFTGRLIKGADFSFAEAGEYYGFWVRSGYGMGEEAFVNFLSGASIWATDSSWRDFFSLRPCCVLDLNINN